jgi:hypothetical protein
MSLAARNQRAAISIIVADHGDPAQCIQDAREDIQPMLHQLADHLQYVYSSSFSGSAPSKRHTAATRVSAASS